MEITVLGAMHIVVASFPDLPTYTQLFYVRLFRLRLKSGKIWSIW